MPAVVGEYICETCGAKLAHPPSPDYHEDYVLPGYTIVVHQFTSSPMIRIYNDGLSGYLAAVPLSQVRENSVREVGQRGSLVVSKWFARRRGWVRENTQPQVEAVCSAVAWVQPDVAHLIPRFNELLAKPWTDVERATGREINAEAMGVSKAEEDALMRVYRDRGFFLSRRGRVEGGVVMVFQPQRRECSPREN